MKKPEKYDGWAIKSRWGLDVRHCRPTRTEIVKDWNMQAKKWGDNSLIWKNISRKNGYKIVKVKLTEVFD